MPEHAPQPMRRPGLLGWLALLPGVLAGFCLGAWMLAIALEWLGDAFFWRNTCASHSGQVLQATWQWWRGSAGAPVWLVENLALASDTLQQGIAALIAPLNRQSGLFWTETVTTVIRCALSSAGNVTLTFLLRLAILFQALRLFALIIVVGLIDGLVRRDLRRFGADHESGFVYHHARRMIGSSLAATGLVWLTVPFFFEPAYILVASSVVIGLIISIMGTTFKKYL
ncbi:TIGR03747 family integrating conjugative element membrane protein [Salmonella enterica subsp. enterica serovar Legon]|uniref:TIGR03747 family integrating conjugative element membrane protein n=1 Tax=Salmonella enterica TaxID=28901 RepID=UPI000D3E98E6|nr:TIGR03747 family integrating conjugative element membrane protein [Salmonella enterica]PVB76038.1 TIGR03747 family integrating conjugative element membrane protein [Salmonella enterica subsp. enterica serovar Legon]PVB88656.1 TIGR03747 family integrating conjugative element membrane protein [Salmonella enterica subsp. enterica serovar Legon]PVB92336.1 TIGR03747 family integrating conjugative element membrane protein [Salmonella enterica subsp. enterica serovar Legon]PVB98585.1 TIGR03747 fami